MRAELGSAEELISSAEASRRGLSTAGAVPVETRREHFYRIGWVEYPVYRVGDLRPKRTVAKKPPEKVDLLAAIFAVNRAAKRYRNAAAAHYTSGTHGFAGSSRRKKEELYTLKDDGIARACLAGRISYCGRHGNLAIYRGEGYCFHSTLEPRNAPEAPSASPDAESPLYVEAKPRGSKEPRLMDAEFTLSELPSVTGPNGGMGLFRRLAAPRFSRESSSDEYEEG